MDEVTLPESRPDDAGATSRWRRRLQRFGLRRLIRKTASELRGGDFKAMADWYLKTLNVEVQHSTAAASVLSAPHARLRIESGIVIANHPGWVDPFVVLSVIDRRDVLLLVHELIYPTLEEELGIEVCARYFVSAADKRSIVPKAAQCIRNGGLFVLFPAGIRGQVFKSTFRRVLAEMQPTDLVYSFRLNAADVSRSEDRRPRLIARLAAALVLPAASGLLSRFAPLVIRVEEGALSAASWKTVAESKSGVEADRALTAMYRDQFGNGRGEGRDQATP